MKPEALVVGSGVGGLVSAILLQARGLRVTVVEAHDSWGGKAGTARVDGVTFDTGPSVLTLPEVFDEVFRVAGTSLDRELELVRLDPAFRYYFPTGAVLDVSHDHEKTLLSIEATFGLRAASEFREYLNDAAKIWEAAAPHFVWSGAPDLRGLFGGGFRRLAAVGRLDAFRTLREAIERRVRTPELVMLLERYATYNGSDARTAPATLGCIAHVELVLGGYGVRGGIFELVEALGRVAVGLGVRFEFGSAVEEIRIERGRVAGVGLGGGRVIAADAVVVNADVAHLFEHLLPSPEKRHVKPAGELSMSAYNAVYRARRAAEPTRPGHAVVFPENYLAEFEDIFEHRRRPRDPTIYLCAQEVAHGRTGWDDDEPLFVMANAPALDESSGEREGDAASDWEIFAGEIEASLVRRGLLDGRDRRVWHRTPSDWASRFPGSRGALYGPASNDKWSAFRRAPNRVAEIPGLYLASGSAHPGGGLPMVAQSGRQAALELLRAKGMDS